MLAQRTWAAAGPRKYAVSPLQLVLTAHPDHPAFVFARLFVVLSSFVVALFVVCAKKVCQNAAN